MVDSMPATTRTTTPARNGRSPRLYSMEILGFIEAPGIAFTDDAGTSPRPVAPSERGRHRKEHPAQVGRGLADRAPVAPSSRLGGSDWRWPLTALVVVTVAAAGLGVAWAAGQADEAAGRERLAVLATTQSLTREIEGLATGEATPAGLARADEAARELFASADLLAEPDDRRRAEEASRIVMEETSRIRSAQAFHSAVIPALVAPDLPADPQLVSIAEGTALFGAWSGDIDSVAGRLPEDALPRAIGTMRSLSEDLPAYLERYADSLRLDDAEGLQAVIFEIEERLTAVADAVEGELADLEASTRAELARAAELLRSIGD